MIPTSSDPASIATGDFNGDGVADLVYDTVSLNGSGSTLHVLLGRGDGTYTDAQEIGLPSPLGGPINVADVNGDGKPDLVLGASGTSITSGVVATLLGNGDGTFGAPVISTFSVSGSAIFISTMWRMGIGDINGDGDVDLVIPDSSNTSLYLLLGNKTGQFQYAGKLFNGSFPTEAFLADLTGDGHLDIVALGPTGGTVTVYLGNGDGTFATGVSYNLPYGPSNMLLIDLDGDGHLDIVAEVLAEVNGQTVPQVQFLHGNGDGTFAPATPIVRSLPAPAGELIDIADYNGDGIPDLVVTDQVGVGVLLGRGNLTYGPLVSYLAGPASYESSSNAFGNFTSSGHRDLAMGVEGGIVELLGNGDGTFASAPFYDLGNRVGSAAITDLNGDGNADVAVTVPAEFPRVLLGKGDGTFQLEADQNTSYGANDPASSIAAADFTGGHVADLAAPSSGGPVSLGAPEVLFGKGDGTFAVPLAEDSGTTNIADFNSDGRADMVSATGSVITVLLGQADGTFATATTPLRTPNGSNSVTAIGDLNGDGKPDLIIGTQIWLGNGDGTFTYKSTVDLSAVGSGQLFAFGSAAIADLDGDGKADLILPSVTNLRAVIILYGNGDGTFQSPVLLPISHNYSAMTVADVNRDGKPDLILNDTAGIAVILNLGNGKFAPEVHYVAGGVIGTVSVADLNHDGYPDIVATNGSGSAGSTVAVLLNQPTVPLPGGTMALGSLIFSPEPSADLQPFQSTLTLTSPTNGGTTPTGVVTFSVDGNFNSDVTLSAGVASFSGLANLSPGIHAINATYNGDDNYRSASYLGLHTVNPPVYATSTILSVTPTSVLTSQTVHMQATVSATGNIPIGYVTFLDGGQTLAAVQLNSSGIAYFDTALLAAGKHTIVAQYDGYTSQNGYNPEILLTSSSAPVTVAVSEIPSATTLSASSANPTSGTVLTLTATVTSAAGTPFGGVTFFDGTTQLGTSSLDGGRATFSSASFSTNQHAFTAVYSANATWARSTSQQLSVNVQAVSSRLVRTFTSVSVTPSPAGPGIRVAALVSSAASVPLGTVTFLMDGTVLGSAPADQNGNVTLLSTATPASGQHQFWASYGGSPVYAPSVSPALDWSQQNPDSGFSLNLDANSVVVSPSSATTIHVLISAPTGSSETISLSCPAGLPQGYTCDFSPASFTAPGVSTLTISGSKLSQSTSETTLWRKGPLCISLALLIFLPFVNRRRFRWPVLLLALSLVLVIPSGCSRTGPHAQTGEVSVLVVRASAGTGSHATVNSAQLMIYMR